jgi:carboxymethylenebutenolidase
MSKWQTATADDGHTFSVYCAEPSAAPRGTVVVLQEIFGVNSHIRDVADRYAADGYLALAPALFERIEPGFETGYGQADIERAIAAMKQVDFDDAIRDLKATLALAKGKCAVVGYCWGGSLAWLAATRLPGLACAISYYGRLAVNYREETPRCPVLFHYGERDASIPLSDVELMRQAQPQQSYHIYPADHGFNCDQRASFDAESAALALRRSRDFLAEHVG